MSLPRYPMLLRVAYFASPLLLPFSAKVRRGLWGRRGLFKRLNQHARFSIRPLWFHFASSGEFEQCLPILEEVKLRDPQQPILLTYFSPSAERALKLEISRRNQNFLPLPWDHADYGPIDLPRQVRKFLDIVNPRAFIAIHREIWPGYLLECQKRNIPRYLFAAYFPTDSKKGLRFFKNWLPLFEEIGTTERSSVERLGQLLDSGPTKIACVGDPRIERVLRRQAQQKIPGWSTFFEKSRVLILASLWPQDFEAIKPGLKALFQLGGWRVLVVPHESHEAFLWECQNWFKSEGQTLRRWSTWITSPEAESHILVDKVGFLAELYRVASLVFVGGSFKSRIHNVLEPAAFANPILTGPYIENSGEALELWKEEGALTRTDSAESFKFDLIRLASDPVLCDALGEKALAYLHKRSGASERYADRIQPK